MDRFWILGLKSNKTRARRAQLNEFAESGLIG